MIDQDVLFLFKNRLKNVKFWPKMQKLKNQISNKSDNVK